MSELSALCEKLGIKVSSKYGAVPVPEGWTPGTHAYKVTLRYQKRQLTVPFFMGPACKAEPSAADVLTCLVNDASVGEQSFEDFCSDFGYDTDSRAHESTHKACVALAPKLRRFLGESFAKVAQAEH